MINLSEIMSIWLIQINNIRPAQLAFRTYQKPCKLTLLPRDDLLAYIFNVVLQDIWG